MSCDEPNLKRPGHGLAVTIAPLGQSPRAVINQLAETTVRGVQLSAAHAGVRPTDLDQSGRRDLLATLRRRELWLAGIDCWIDSAQLTDPARSEAALHHVLSVIRLAGDLDRCPVSMALGHRDDEQGSALIDVVDVIAGHAEHIGVRIANHQPNTAETLRGDANGTGIDVGIDPAASLAQGRDPAQAVLACGKRLRCARLVDLLMTGVRAPIGQQDGAQLDLASYAAALAAVGFTGPLIIDARQWDDPWSGVGQSVDRWGQVVQMGVR